MEEQNCKFIELIEEVVDLVYRKRIPAKECAEIVGRTANWFTNLSRPHENYEKFEQIRDYLINEAPREKSTRGRKKKIEGEE